MNSVLENRGRKGDWTQTFTGKAFWVFDPRVDEICIEDIAHSLSNQCRYAGHCKRFYSVAEHCIHVASLCTKENVMWGLLHDATETYLVDLPRPIKWHLPEYKIIESELEVLVAKKFNLCYPIPNEVKFIDDAILDCERKQNMSTPPYDWEIHGNGIYIEIQCWSPIKAEKLFLELYEKIRKNES